MKKIQTRIKVVPSHDSMEHNSEERSRQIDEVLDRRATRQKISMDAHYENFFFYKRYIDDQDFCPCRTDTDPAPSCTLCKGFGHLPPFILLGHTTNILLTADTLVSTLNMKVNYDSENNPPQWELLETALNGRLESDWITVMPNDAEDLLIWTTLTSEEDEHITIEFTVNGIEWMNIESLKDYIMSCSKLKIRVTFSRDSVNDEVPKFSGLFIQYRNKGFEDIKGTQPQWAISNERTISGRLELLDNGIFIATGAISSVEVGDFFEHKSTGTRFRVQSIENQTSYLGTIMEWTLQVRKVQSSEVIANV